MHRIKKHATLISETGLPATESSLQQDFEALGLKTGMTIIAHSSLSQLGWVVGGAAAVLLALESVLGLEGTLVMPAFSGNNTEPSYWEAPPVPEEWWPIIRAEAPPFMPDLTPTRMMGAIAETFRIQNGSIRSHHPAVSFVAKGPKAPAIIADHPLHYPLGEHSPLAKLYDLDASILLLGVDHSNNTSLHLSEERAKLPKQKIQEQGGAILENGVRKWVKYKQLDYNDGDFAFIGTAFEMEMPEAVKKAQVGKATARLVHMRSVVDFGVKWLQKNRIY